jgi:hypothetical protein
LQCSNNRFGQGLQTSRTVDDLKKDAPWLHARLLRFERSLGTFVIKSTSWLLLIPLAARVEKPTWGRCAKRK